MRQKRKQESSSTAQGRSLFGRLLALVGWLVGLLGVLASVLALFQFLSDGPEVTPVDFGAIDPFTAQFIVKNPMLVSMSDVEIGTNLGGMVVYGTGGDPGVQNSDWQTKEAGFADWVCQDLIGAGSVKESASINLVIGEQDYDRIAPKEAVRSKAWTMTQTKDSRGLFGIGITYRLKILNWVLPLPKKSVCLTFDTETDPSGHAHLIPYKKPLPKK